MKAPFFQLVLDNDGDMDTFCFRTLPEYLNGKKDIPLGQNVFHAQVEGINLFFSDVSDIFDYIFINYHTSGNGLLPVLSENRLSSEKDSFNPDGLRKLVIPFQISEEVYTVYCSPTCAYILSDGYLIHSFQALYPNIPSEALIIGASYNYVAKGLAYYASEALDLTMLAREIEYCRIHAPGTFEFDISTFVSLSSLPCVAM